MRSRASLASVAVLCASIGVLALACGSSPDPNSIYGDRDGGASSSGGGDDDDTSSGKFGGSTSSGGTDSGADAGNCFAPVEMYIMLDKSGSMGDPIGNGAPGDCNVGDTKGSKWCRAINALAGYLKSNESKDQSAALQFFSDANQNACKTGSGFDTAAQPGTGYKVLPSTDFESTLNAITPGGGTGMEAALRGLIGFTKANRTPGKVTIGILITDGDPQGCNGSGDGVGDNVGQLSNLIAQHFTDTKIRTYVIGMNGGTFSNLEQLGTGGGGPAHAATVGTLTNACGNIAAPCHVWNVGDGDPAGFIQALAAIQESADGCKPGGGTVNPPN